MKLLIMINYKSLIMFADILLCLSIACLIVKLKFGLILVYLLNK